MGDTAHVCVRRRSGLRGRAEGRGPQLAGAPPRGRLTCDMAAASGQPVSPGSLPVLGFLERLKTEK